MNNSRLQCLTKKGNMSDCTLGKFMIFKDRRFKVSIKFKKVIEFTSGYDYHAKFTYFKEGTDCKNDDMYLNINLKALDIIEPITIVNSTYTLKLLPRWNELSSCIRVGYDTNYTVRDLLEK